MSFVGWEFSALLFAAEVLSICLKGGVAPAQVAFASGGARLVRTSRAASWQFPSRIRGMPMVLVSGNLFPDNLSVGSRRSLREAKARRVLRDGNVESSPGDRIGNYRIECELGLSGSGLLLAAQHVVLPRRAILKVVHTAFATVQSYIVQALREACILEAIAHPGIPILYEAGLLEDRRPWLAFEASTGPTLDDLLASGAFPLIEVAALLRDVAGILEHTHHRGVIHRGLRPDRIVITPDRRYPLCIPDWSEALVHDTTTPVRQIVPEGSRSYVAPELLREHAGGPPGLVDGGVDVFALGVIAHRALTGSLPIAPGLGSEPFAPSIERRPDAPHDLAALIDSMLAFDPCERPSAFEVRSRVDWLFATDSQLHALAAATSDAAAESPPTPPSSKDEIVLLTQQRLRQPRWTPRVHDAEPSEFDDDTSAQDEFMA
jgi:serine/threonine protein kinase